MLRSPSFRQRPTMPPRSSRARLRMEALESRDLLSAFALGPLTQVSGPSPFNGSPYQPEIVRDFEFEAAVAVNPNDPGNIVSAWMQDLAIGIVAGASLDGGQTWQSTALPGLTLASGGAEQTAADQWVTFAANGDVYVASVQNNFFTPHQRGSAIRVNKSTDGGLTWSEPITLVEDNSAAWNRHNPFITADPADANRVYIVWYQYAHNQLANNSIWFARTIDGGQTWEAPAAVAFTPNNDLRSFAQLFVQPDGALVIVALEDVRQGKQLKQYLVTFRSTDQGATWSAPVRGAQMFLDTGPHPFGVIDPDTGQDVSGGGPDFAMDPSNGDLYAVWEDYRFLDGQFRSIAFSMSTDSGQTWSAPILINRTPTGIELGNRQAFLPSVAVADDGTIGISYYDFRNNTPAAGLPTDYWFIYADSTAVLTDPESWNELRLTDTSFDLQAAPFFPGIRGLFLGDKQALATAGNDFVPIWTMPHAPDPGSTFFRSIERIGDDGLRAASLGSTVGVDPFTSGRSAPVGSEAVAFWQAAASLRTFDISRMSDDPGGTSSAEIYGKRSERNLTLGGLFVSEFVDVGLFADTITENQTTINGVDNLGIFFADPDTELSECFAGDPQIFG